MIQATLYHNRFEMRGHALPEEGEDYVRVCASATTLAFLLGDALDEKDKLKGYDIQTGCLTLAYQPGATARRVADVVDCGFRRLARDYPNYIQYQNCAGKRIATAQAPRNDKDGRFADTADGCEPSLRVDGEAVQ